MCCFLNIFEYIDRYRSYNIAEYCWGGDIGIYGMAVLACFS